MSELRLRKTLLICLGATLLLPLFGAEHEQSAPKRGPRDILWRLRQGNNAYVAGRHSNAQVTPGRRVSLVPAQHPHAVVLTCADSRVPPEYIFNEGLGSLFVVRVAGAVADPVTVGSMEYGVEHLHAPLIVVMGHTRCGAVKAAIETPAPLAPATGPGANIESILTLIRPGIPQAATHDDPWTSAVYGGVEQTIADLFRTSKIVPEMTKAGEVGVIGAVYEIETGKVKFSQMFTRDGPENSTESVHPLEWKSAPTVTSARAHPPTHH